MCTNAPNIDDVVHTAFNRSSTTLFDTNGYDAVWCIPSFCKHAGFLKTLFRAEVKPAPYVWSPYFFDGTTRLLHQRRSYTNRGKAGGNWHP